MNTENLYVVAFHYGKGEDYAEQLVTKKVFTSKEEAEKTITDSEYMMVLTLEMWGEAKYNYGYGEAYG